MGLRAGSTLTCVEVQAERLAIKLIRKGDRRTNGKVGNTRFYIPWKKNALKCRREIIVPPSSGQDVRPIRSETRVALLTSIVCGRRWLDEIVTGSVADVEEIDARQKCKRATISASSRRANLMTCREIPYATEQGIFGSLTGNFFQRTGNSRARTGNSTSDHFFDLTRPK